MTRKTYPIILAHGFARFDVVSNGLLTIDNHADQDSLHYFRNIRSCLMRDGFDVRHSNVDWAGSLIKRAADLKGEVETALQLFEADRIHIIGHSMGGLDARRMLFEFQDEDLHKKVVSVTTIGTPHHGWFPCRGVSAGESSRPDQRPRHGGRRAAGHHGGGDEAAQSGA